MRIEHLQYILEIASAGSISKASENLHLSHQSLHKTLTKLEAELNTTIFDRTAQGVTLTEAGQLVKNYAEEMIAKTNLLQADLQQLKQRKVHTQKGSLYCEISTNVRQLIFVKFIEQFSDIYPELTLTIKEMESPKIIAHLKQSLCHFGIVTWNKGMPPDFSEESQIIQKILFEDKVYATFAINHPLNRYQTLSFKTIIQYPLAIYLVNEEEDHTLVQFLKRHYPQAKIRMISNHLQAIEQQIQTGQAVGITPENFLRNSSFFSSNDRIRAIKIKDCLPQIVAVLIHRDYYEEKQAIIDSFLHLLMQSHNL